MSKITEHQLKQLQAQVDDNMADAEVGPLLAYITTLQEERDQARREACTLAAYKNAKRTSWLFPMLTDGRPPTASELADSAGWDCFKTVKSEKVAQSD